MKNFCLRAWASIARPYYLTRLLSEVLLSFVLIYALSGGNYYDALCIGKFTGVLMTSCTFLWLLYSLFRGNEDGITFSSNPLLIIGRCLLTVVVDIFVLYLCFVVVLRVLANGPEFFADGLTIPRDVSVVEPQKCNDIMPFLNCQRTNCVPYIMLSLDSPQICYGALNPREKGEMDLRIYELTTGKMLLEYSDSLFERFGMEMKPLRWSVEQNECFAFFRPLNVLPGRSERSYVVIVEIWFYPESGSSSRLLISQHFLVHGGY